MGEARVTRPFHAVRFFAAAESPGGIVAAFLGAGFVAREPALVIATPEHRSAILSGLRGLNFSIEALQTSGNLRLLDASDSVTTVVMNGSPDPVRFEAFGSAAVGQLARPRSSGVRVYSEMVDLLWHRDESAAVRLEMLWDRLTGTHHCSLLCGYASRDRRARAGRRIVCAQHSHVLADNGLPHPLVS
jgi:hypothetical protein